MLLRAGVPYRIVGGTRFFDRAEIRDVMAYLTLVVNPADDIAAKRTTPRNSWMFSMRPRASSVPSFCSASMSPA